jgi:hypothetical protein
MVQAGLQGIDVWKVRDQPKRKKPRKVEKDSDGGMKTG